jgi:hypothetical protein
MLTLIEPMDGYCTASLEDIESCSLSSQFLNVSNVDYMFVFSTVSIYAMFWYMCESMEVVSACVAHVCGVCNTVHKYVHCYACYFTCFYYSPPRVCPYFPMVMCVIFYAMFLIFCHNNNIAQ